MAKGATTAHFDKLLTQLVEGVDRLRSGTLIFNNGQAKLCYMMGLPTFAAFEESSGTRLLGPDAVAAIASRLSRPTRFKWVREMEAEENLDMESDDFLDLVEREGRATISPAPPANPSAIPVATPVGVVDEGDSTGAFASLRPTAQPASGLSGTAEGGESPDPLTGHSSAASHITLTNFPALPLGQPLLASMPAAALHLDAFVGGLASAIIVQTDDDLRAAVVVVDGLITDAVFATRQQTLVGRAAAEAMLACTQGFVSSYMVEPALAAATSMLWRLPVAHRHIDASWLDVSRFLDSISDRPQGERAVLATGRSDQAAALFANGRLVCAYTASDPTPRTSLESVADLLAQSGVLVTVLDEGGLDTLNAAVVSDDVFHRKAEDEASLSTAVADLDSMAAGGEDTDPEEPLLDTPPLWTSADVVDDAGVEPGPTSSSELSQIPPEPAAEAIAPSSEAFLDAEAVAHPPAGWAYTDATGAIDATDASELGATEPTAAAETDPPAWDTASEEPQSLSEWLALEERRALEQRQGQGLDLDQASGTTNADDADLPPRDDRDPAAATSPQTFPDVASAPPSDVSDDVDGTSWFLSPAADEDARDEPTASVSLDVTDESPTPVDASDETSPNTWPSTSAPTRSLFAWGSGEDAATNATPQWREQVIAPSIDHAPSSTMDAEAVEEEVGSATLASAGIVVDWDRVLANQADIATTYLGERAEIVRAIIYAGERNVHGIRVMLDKVRDTAIPDVSVDIMKAMVFTMRREAAIDVSGTE